MTYFACYRDGKQGLLQHLLVFPKTIFEAAQPPVSWWVNFRRLTRQLVSSPGVDFAIRSDLRDNRLERVLMLLAPQQRKSEIIDLGAGFLGLNAIVAGSVGAPSDRHEHDRIAAAFPPFRARALQDVYAPSHGDNGARLVDDFRLIPAIGDLFDLALTRRWAFAYQLNARRHHAETGDLHWSQHNLERVRGERYLPPAVRASQEAVAERINRAAFLIEEFVGCDDSAVMNRMDEAISESVSRPYGFPKKMLDARPDRAFDDQLSIGLHSSCTALFQPWQNVAGSAAREEILSVLDWRPPDGYLQTIGNASRVPEREEEYLRRIEERLSAIERELARRQVVPQPSEYVELKDTLAHARINPRNSLAVARLILERIVSRLYRQHCKGNEKDLFGNIEELLKSSIFPKSVRSYLHTVRVLGNIVLHDLPNPELTSVDVEITLLSLLQVVAWYVLEYRPSALD